MHTKTNQRRVGVLLGGSGLIGGAITHFFKTKCGAEFDLLAPSSKKLSLRVPNDINQYLKKIKPDFIINAAIAAIDSDPQLAFETNYLGSINLAKAAIQLQIPYIHMSSSACMPTGTNLKDDELLPLTPQMSNYPKSKLMTELTLRHLAENEGLDYTILRLAVVYGKHDHKIQGFHRLFFSIVTQAVPLMLTKRGVQHSYSNTKKLPPLIRHLLDHRQEFSGQSYNFIDPNPVEFAKLILTIKSYLQLGLPKEIYIPYPLAKMGQSWLKWIMHKLSAISIEARMPGELLFLENCYKSQTLSCEKLANSSFGLANPETTIFTELPAMIEYYLTRWEHLNLIPTTDDSFYHPKMLTGDFSKNPEELLQTIHAKKVDVLSNFSDLC